MQTRDKRALKIGFWLFALFAGLMLITAPTLDRAVLFITVLGFGVPLYKKSSKPVDDHDHEPNLDAYIPSGEISKKNWLVICVCAVAIPLLVVSNMQFKDSSSKYLLFCLFSFLGLFFSTLFMCIGRSLTSTSPKKDGNQT